MALTRPLREVATGEVYEAFDIDGTTATIYSQANAKFETADLSTGDYVAYWGQQNNAPVPAPKAVQNVIPADLAEWSTGSPVSLDYGLTAVIYDNNIIKVATTSAVPVYVDGQMKKGNWIGVGIEIPADTDLSKTTYYISDDPATALRPLNQTSPDKTVGSKTYIEFYFDVGNSHPRNFIGVSWDGTNGSRVTYRVDYSDVMITKEPYSA